MSIAASGYTAGARDPELPDIYKFAEGRLEVSITLDYLRARDMDNSTVTVLRKGLILGKITTGGKYRAFEQEYTIGAAGAAAGQKVIPLVSSSGLVAADIIYITDTAGNVETRTIDTVDSVTQITITENLTNDLLSGEIAYCMGGASLDADALVLTEEVTIGSVDVIVSATSSGNMDESACVNVDRLTKTSVQRLIWH